MKIDQFEAYKIAIDNRNLEIKLFWQRSLFFAAFISAIFIGYTNQDIVPLPAPLPSENIIQTTQVTKQPLKLLLASLGLVFSFAWILANRGSKYWCESWEKKIFNIEKDAMIDQNSSPPNGMQNDITEYELFTSWEKPHKQFFLYKARLFSVSKIAMYVADLIFISYLILLLKEIFFYFNLSFISQLNNRLIVFLYVTALVVAILLLILGTRTKVPQEVKDEWKDNRA